MPITKFLFSFRGRINRLQFWGYAIAQGVFMLFLGFIATSIPDPIYASVEPPSPFLLIMYFIVIPALVLLTIYMDFAVCVKRLHDTNRSGACVLIALLPIIGLVYVLAVCGILRGTDGENDYGPPVDKIAYR